MAKIVCRCVQRLQPKNLVNSHVVLDETTPVKYDAEAAASESESICSLQRYDDVIVVCCYTLWARARIFISLWEYADTYMYRDSTSVACSGVRSKGVARSTTDKS
jgi:hypothetical protein